MQNYRIILNLTTLCPKNHENGMTQRIRAAENGTRDFRERRGADRVGGYWHGAAALVSGGSASSIPMALAANPPMVPVAREYQKGCSS